MTRRPRTVRFDAQELEGRLLLAALPVAPARPKPAPYYVVQFGGAGAPNFGPDTSQETQVVSQQAGTATLMLSRTQVRRTPYGTPVYLGGVGTLPTPLQVEVKTDPSPAVGVNVGAVDQTVTFARGRSQAAVSVPILAGAANPGEVDVTLTATPMNPPSKLPTDVTSSGSLELRILAPDASLPPRIIAEQGTRQGIVLAFNKPMDPAAASNVQNYAVRATTTYEKTNAFLNTFNLLTFPLHMDSAWGISTVSTSRTVPLRAAEYDPATNSVTLIPRRRLTYLSEITVTQGSGMKTSSRPAHPSDAPLGLTDVEGNPINADSSPGKFSVSVESTFVSG
jgi:hypothetical protein